MRYFNQKLEFYKHKINDKVRSNFLSDKYCSKKWLANDDDFEKMKQNYATIIQENVLAELKKDISEKSQVFNLDFF